MTIDANRDSSSVVCEFMCGCGGMMDVFDFCVISSSIGLNNKLKIGKKYFILN